MSRRISRGRFLRTAVGGLGAMALGSRLTLSDAFSRHALTRTEKVEQLFVISFSGTTAGPDILSLLERRAVGGIILFERNCVSASQTRNLIAELQATARYPLLVCADQEGGTVVRIHHGAPVYPSEAVYGRLDSSARVAHDAAITAIDLRKLGLTQNLAPVVDVLTNPKSPIGQRSYGRHPRIDMALSSAAIRGYQSNGLAATAKHFIGLGHTVIDSHHFLPTVNLSLQQLQRSDLMVFKAAIDAGVSTIMVAHVALPKIDPVANRPASLSPVIIRNVIRGLLGFKGAIITDSLLMGALPNGNSSEAAERALGAGADLLLVGSNQDVPIAVIEDAMDRVTGAVNSGRIPESRLDDAVARVAALKQQYPARLATWSRRHSPDNSSLSWP